MPKKHKKNKKKVDEITDQLSSKCQIATKSNLKPLSKIVLDEEIDPLLLAKWPKLKLKVPPVFLHKPVDFEQHVKKVINLGIKFYQPHKGQNFTRIICQSFNDHKYLLQYLDKKQLPYHTYGNPSKRKMKVVIRGLPSNTGLNIIKEVLKSASIPIIRVHKMITKDDRKDKTMLVLAVVPYDDKGKVILKIKQLLGHEVTLEPPKNKLSQCFRCQKWGHSQRYCHGQIKCVKCAGDHLTKKCEKTADQEPKCANCSNSHTASYRKCVYAHGTEDFNTLKKVERSCCKPRLLVTVDNYNTLYRNIDYSKKSSKSI